MTGVLRLAVGALVLTRIQRVLVGSGLLVCNVSLVVGWLFETRATAPLLLLGYLLIALPAPLHAGWLFRLLSASRVHNLAPHFRVRMLVSLLLFVGLIAATAVLATWALPRAPGAPAAALVVFVACTVLFLGAFIASASPHALLAVAATGAVVPLVWSRTGAASHVAAAGVDPTAALAVAAAAGWIAFGWWYVTTPRVRPPGWMTTPGDPAGAAEDWERRLTRASAVRSCLTGVFAARNVRRDVSLALLVLPFAWGALRVLSSLTSSPAGTYMGGLAWVLLFGGLYAANAARRARGLWLLGGSRADLFRTVERHVFRMVPIWAALVLVMGTAFAPGAFLDPLGPSGVLWLAVLLLTLAFFSTYCGLMFVEGWRAPDVVFVGLLLACTLVFLVAFGRPPESAVLPWVAAMQVAGGLACRVIARRRWERIDWLRLRPIRWLTPRLPARG